MFGLRSRALRTVFLWQGLATLVVASIAAVVAGMHGAVSAALGGGTSMLAGLVAGLLVQRRKTKVAGDMLFAAITAEAVRIALMLVALGLIFAIYDDVVPGSLIGAFIVTVLVFSMAFFVRENR